MQASFPSKLPNTGVSIFTVMSLLALEHKAINLGQGTPDFTISPQLIELVFKAMKDGHNQYAHRNGLLSLRKEIAEKIHFLYNCTVNPDTEITITPGATYGIYTALTTILRPGDEVIVFEPAYDSYVPNIVVNGARPILIPCQHPEYKIDWNLVKEKITPATKMIILNSPNNPSGQILNKSDIENLTKIIEGTNIILLSDEVYEHILFDGKIHESILKYPDLFQRAFVVFSFGKVYQCTGWKIGYCVAPGWLMKEFSKVHQYNCFSVNTPVQYALATFLKDKNEYLHLGSFFQEKRDLFTSLMSQTKFKAIPSYGSYFQLYDYSEISAENEFNFAKILTEKARIATIPVSSFYQQGTQNNVLRFCFAKKNETLQTAVERLLDFQNQIM